MKKIENNFVVTGFVGKDAEIRQFTNASVARFPLAVSRLENNGEESKRVSAFMNFEAWRKNENTGSFDQLTKGTMLTVEGYFKPEEWSDQSGVKHNRIVMVAVKFYPPVEKEETPEKPAKPAKKGKKLSLPYHDKSGLRVAFVLLITVLLHHLYFYTLLVLFYRIQKCFGRFECRDIVSGNFNCRILRNVPGRLFSSPFDDKATEPAQEHLVSRNHRLFYIFHE